MQINVENRFHSHGQVRALTFGDEQNSFGQSVMYGFIFLFNGYKPSSQQKIPTFSTKLGKININSIN